MVNRRNFCDKSAKKDLHRMPLKKQIVGRFWSYEFIFSLRLFDKMSYFVNFFSNSKNLDDIFAIAKGQVLGLYSKIRTFLVMTK